MNNRDTINLLKECSSGIRSGVYNLNELANRARSPELKAALTQSIANHEALGSNTTNLLAGDMQTPKEPSIMMKGMSWAKNEAKLAMDDSDSTIACLVTDGCGMGIKSLNQSINDFTKASAEAKGIAQQVINEEKALMERISKFL